MKIIAILAMTDKGIIGHDNSLIWNIPEDMKRFRELTSGNVVIMGKNTYFSLPEKFRPLPNRRNIVFTHGSIEWVECVKDFSELQNLLQNEKRKIFLIGWAKLYNYFFENNLVDEVELTLVEGDYEGNIRVGDFRKNFSEISRDKFSHGYFITLIKNNMNRGEQQYLDLLQKIMETGVDRMDRTGIGTRSIFGHQIRFDLSEGFPLLTTKKVYIKAIIYELLWFLSGDTNIRFLVQNNVKIWNEWAFSQYIKRNNLSEKFPRYSDEWHRELESFVEKIKNDENFAKEWGDLGPVYGKQWRSWDTREGNSIDQIQNALNIIMNDPYSRRNIVSGWNVGEIENLVRDKDAAPPPCHTLFQFYVADGKLSCQLYQRSADVFLGVPFNIASYALLTMMIAKVTGLEVWEFVHTFGDVHIYNNHFNQVKEQISRSPRVFPTMKIADKKDLFSFEFEDFELVSYNPYEAIKAPIAV